MRLLALCLLTSCLAVYSGQRADTNNITKDSALGAQRVIGLEFSDSKVEMILPGLREQLELCEVLRAFPLSNSVPPCLWFNPVPARTGFDYRHSKIKLSSMPATRRPQTPEELAYCSVRELGTLLKSRQVTSEQLTRIFIDRLRQYSPKLECVVTITEELALNQARAADAEIRAGRYRGPLHGIPYAAKDLLAVKGIPTTWGAAPYTNQLFSENATVIQKLEKAGAVLVAKTTLGELAMGDVWFGGMTRNPWNVKEGSSGSSAGSCAGMSAGLFAFAIGSETYGSIVSPSDRCGVTGLRPTFGRVSRTGAMTLSWSMDKLGPICRTAEDCAVVLDAICGPDGIDQTVQDVPFVYDSRMKLEKLRIGYLQKDFEQEKGERKQHDEATLAQYRAAGATLIPVELPSYPVDAISVVLSTEAATAFDDLTRNCRDDWLKQQEPGSWPNTFRRHRFVPAVEYLQAQRIRYLLIQDTAKLFKQVDVLIAPSLSGSSLLLGNLTGHPCLVLPNGFSKDGTPTSICLIGRLFEEGKLILVAKRYQDVTRFHLQRPSMN